MLITQEIDIMNFIHRAAMKLGFSQAAGKSNVDLPGRCFPARAARRKDVSRRKATDYEVLETRQLLAGDLVLQWNEQLLDAIRMSNTPPPVASRAMAIVHTAIFDAVNSIANEFKPYAMLVAVHPKASVEAAISAAAERTLANLFPSMRPAFWAKHISVLDSIPDGIRETQGVVAGRAAANAILAMRAHDGWDAVIGYTSGTNPGDWVPTAPGFLPPALPQWGQVETWVMSSGSQFRPISPPDLGSNRYAVDYNMVKDWGAVNSTVRTAAQTQVARIWAGGPGTATPPGQWNMIAQDLAVSQGNSLYENARMFAMLNVSLADAAICAWDGKYEFDYWRPVTAIRNGDGDSNAATQKDASWTPLLTTPNFPTYTSGHSTFSGAASAALTGFFGTDSLNFKLVSEFPGVITRYYDSLDQAAREAGFSRIFGGIHFNFDNVEALKAGRKIGNLVASTMMQSQAEVVAHVNDNSLYIMGTTYNDRIFVSRSGPEVIVRNHGQLVGRFAISGLWSVVVNGSAGNDRIDFHQNVRTHAVVFGGDGNDNVFGGGGINWLYGEGGSDSLFGGRNADHIFGGEGNDWLFGLADADYLDGGLGWNHLYGGSANDRLWGTVGFDRLFGGGGTDSINWRNS